MKKFLLKQRDWLPLIILALMAFSVISHEGNYIKESKSIMIIDLIVTGISGLLYFYIYFYCGGKEADEKEAAELKKIMHNELMEEALQKEKDLIEYKTKKATEEPSK